MGWECLPTFTLECGHVSPKVNNPYMEHLGYRIYGVVPLNVRLKNWTLPPRTKKQVFSLIPKIFSEKSPDVSIYDMSIPTWMAQIYAKLAVSPHGNGAPNGNQIYTFCP